MLEVDIKKKLGDFKLQVSFCANSGTVGLLGVSGCGKSMTLKCIAGIETPDEGRIVLNGRTLFDSEKKINLPPQKRRVGYLFQQYALFPNMTVYQNIAISVRKKGKEREITEEMIKRLCLEGLEDKRPGQLSGGQQQRVALARILVNEPEILLLDEPFSALDSYLKWELEMELSDALRDFGGVSVFVSHNRREVYRLCDTVCVLSEGKSEPICPVKTLFEDPKTVAGCKLAGCRNFSKVQAVDEKTLKAIDWGVELRVSSNIVANVTQIGVREDKLKLAEEMDENIMHCRVGRVTEDEKEYILMLKVCSEDGRESQLGMELSKKILPPKEGEYIDVSVAPSDIILLEE